MKVLSQFVQNLVAKIAELRGVDAEALLAEPEESGARSAPALGASASLPGSALATEWARTASERRPVSSSQRVSDRDENRRPQTATARPWGASATAKPATVRKKAHRAPSPHFEVAGQSARLGDP